MTRRFVLVRDVDETGISGTGIVAWGVEFPDGVAVLRWASEHRSTAVYASMDGIVAIHGHNGSTRIEWWDAADYATAALAEERHDCDRLAEALRLYYLAAGRPDREVEALLADHATKRGTSAEDPYYDLSVAQVRHALRHRGLSDEGARPALVARLLASDNPS